MTKAALVYEIGSFSLSIWDLVLITVVSLQVTAVAYLHLPRWKALVLCLPFPFTTIALGLGRPVDVTNILGMVAIFLYVHSIRLLHQRLRVPIVPAIALSLVGYCLFSWILVDLAPVTPGAFWAAGGLVCLLALALHSRLRSRLEPGHRTPMPIWLKLPLIVAVVFLLSLIKESLQGFATMFPMVTVVGAYETRHSLWTLGRQMPIFLLTMTPMMGVVRLTQDFLGLGGALLLGWIAFLTVLLPLLHRLWTRETVG